jgi:hypothetical protein
MFYLTLAALVWCNNNKIIWDRSNFVVAESLAPIDKMLTGPHSQIDYKTKYNNTNIIYVSFDKSVYRAELAVHWPAIYPVDFALWFCCPDTKCQEPVLAIQMLHTAILAPGMHVEDVLFGIVLDSSFLGVPRRVFPTIFTCILAFGLSLFVKWGKIKQA